MRINFKIDDASEFIVQHNRRKRMYLNNFSQKIYTNESSCRSFYFLCFNVSGGNFTLPVVSSSFQRRVSAGYVAN